MAVNKRQFYQEALKAEKKGNIEKAIHILSQLAEQDPNEVRALHELIRLYTKKGDTKKAVEISLELSRRQMDAGFYPKALGILKSALSLDKRNIDIYRELVTVYKNLNYRGELINVIKQAVAILEEEGRLEEEKEFLQKLLEVEPDNVAGRFKLAELYMKEGDTASAQREFEELVDALEKQGKYKEMAVVLEKKIKVGLDDPATREKLCESYVKLKEWKKAIEHLQFFIKTGRTNEKILWLMGEALEGIGKPDKALKVYKQLLRLYKSRGDTGKLQMVAKRILKLSPEDADVKEALSETQAKIVEKEREEEEVAEGEEEKAKKLINKFLVSVKYGLISTAKAVLDEMLPLLTDVNAVRNYAKMCVKFRYPEGAEKLFKRALELAESDPSLKEEILAEVKSILPDSSLVEDIPSEEEVELTEPEEEEVELTTSAEFVEREAPEQEVEIEEPQEEEPEVEVEEEEITLEEATHGDELSEPVEEEVSIEEEPEIEVEEEVVAQETFSQEVEQEIPQEEIEEEISVESDVEEPPQEEIELEVGGFEVEESAPEASHEELSISEEGEVGEVEVEEEVVEVGAQEEEAPFLEEEPGEDVAASAPEVEQPAPPEEEEELVTEEDIMEAFRSDEVDVEAPEEPVEVPEMDESAADSITLEDDLSEAEFYINQGLYEEAKEVLKKILERRPNYPKAQELLARVEELEKATEAYADMGEENIVVADQQPQEEPAFEGDILEGDWDLKEVLNGELSEEQPQESSSSLSEPTHQVSAEQVLMEFKKGVKKILKEEEGQAHYDLGLAYLEMGLFDEAIEEFFIAMKSPELKVVSMVMIGICYINKSDPENAIKVLEEAYAEAQEDQKLDIEYHLGVAFEMKNEYEKALEWFEKVYSKDPQFKDVQQRVEMLRSLKKEEEERAQEEKEFERLTLEDILGDEFDETESEIIPVASAPASKPSSSEQKPEPAVTTEKTPSASVEEKVQRSEPPSPEPKEPPAPKQKKPPSKKKITFV